MTQPLNDIKRPRPLQPHTTKSFSATLPSFDRYSSHWLWTATFNHLYHQISYQKLVRMVDIRPPSQLVRLSEAETNIDLKDLFPVDSALVIYSQKQTAFDQVGGAAHL